MGPEEKNKEREVSTKWGQRRKINKGKYPQSGARGEKISEGTREV